MYKYYLAHKAGLSNRVGERWKEDFQALLNDQFENSSTFQTIEEETFFDSKEYQNVDARIVHVINTETGEKVGDDWKNILFKNINQPVYLGRYYRFDNNYWLTVNVDAIKSLTKTVAVRRCNNVLRWIDNNGQYHEIPCYLDRKILENRNYSTAGSSFVSPSGIIEITTQLNNETNLIQPNQRFLFGNPGNWTAFKVQGGGVSNFDNLSTTDNTSVGLLKLTMGIDYENDETDDFELGIAEYYKYNYTISFSNFSGNVGETLALNPVVKLNGEIVQRNFQWIIEDEDVLSIENNVATFIKEGTTSIRCQLFENRFVYVDVVAVSSGIPINKFEIRINRNENFIFEGDTETFSVGLYENGVLQPDAFTFTIIPNTVPSFNYVFVAVDNNTFTIKNIKRFLTDTLDVQCNSGIYSRTYKFNLRGDW